MMVSGRRRKSCRGSRTKRRKGKESGMQQDGRMAHYSDGILKKYISAIKHFFLSNSNYLPFSFITMGVIDKYLGSKYF